MPQLKYDDIYQRHLGRTIARQAEVNGDNVFIMFDDRRYTFSETNQKVNELAAGLSAKGFGVGDRLAFFMSSPPEIIFLVLAVNKLGGAWIPINTDYKGVWLEDTITRSRPAILVTDAAHANRLTQVQAKLSEIKTVVLGDSGRLSGAIRFDSLYHVSAGEPDMSALDYSDTCAILWTSGTTGRSKGVMQSHNVWFNTCLASNRECRTTENDVIYCVLPLYNTGAWASTIFRALIAGVALAIDPSFSVSNFWQRVRHYGVTQTFTLGAMHMFLWNAPEKPDDVDNSLRTLQAIPMPYDIIEPFSKRFGVEILGQGMAQSEALMVVNQYIADRASWRPGSCGSPTPLADVKLMDDHGNEVGVGEHGECWIRPKQAHSIFTGYFDDPEATRNAYEGEWYKTGDLLKRDSNNAFYFVDRLKDAVRLKGRNISTFEIELVVRQHPAVLDCAVFGIQSETLKTESDIKLDIILQPQYSPAEMDIAKYINDNAPYFFVPRYIEFVSELPYTPTKKVQKYVLRDKGLTENTWDANQAGFKAKR